MHSKALSGLISCTYSSYTVARFQMAFNHVQLYFIKVSALVILHFFASSQLNSMIFILNHWQYSLFLEQLKYI